MKILILILSIISFYAFADCRSDFNAGVSQNNRGVSYVQQASIEFENALEEAKSSHPDGEYICESLENSKMSSWLGGKQFKKAILSFRKAYIQCEGENEQTAKKQRRLNEKNLESQREYLEQICNTLSELCDAPCSPVFLKL